MSRVLELWALGEEEEEALIENSGQGGMKLTKIVKHKHSTPTFSMLARILYHSLPVNKFYIPWCPRSRKLEKGEERFYFS